ncbi:MAG: hypothetical protein Q8P98_13475, partial [Candidatus Rokubacteria bacterium]|nr:hypothetical protein [Candidatus Rokubacteria bacterium]
GFRSCAASTGVPGQPAQARRLVQTEASRANSELRRRWLARQWEAHAARIHESRSAAVGERDMVRHGVTPMAEGD